MLRILALLLFSLVPPELGVHWQGDRVPLRLNLFVEGGEALSRQCLTSGLELRHRFEFQLCRRRNWWVDRCGEKSIETRALQLDPISLSYRLEVDRLSDREDPVTHMPDTETAALQRLVQTEPIMLSSLLTSLGPSNSSADSFYLLARVLTYCRGDTSRTLRKLSYYLSLGLVRGTVYDSGWVAFDLDIPK